MPFHDVQTHALLVEFADAGLGNFGNKRDLAGNRPLIDVTLLNEWFEMLLQFLCIERMTFADNQQGKRPLAPLRISNADHGHFANGRVSAAQVFEFQRRNPLAAGLDHVLDAVTNIDKPHVVQRRYIAGAQPAARPQFGTFFRLTIVAFCQPGRAQDQFTLGFAIGRQKVALLIDDRGVYQHSRNPGLDPVGDLFVFAAGFQLFVDVRDRNQRSGFRHAVGSGELNALGLGRLIQAAIQCAAANDDFPAAEIDILSRLGVEQHLQDGRHAMREGDLLPAPQLHQQFGLVAAGIDLLEPQHGRGIRNAPGVHMEHRSDGHVDVIGAEQPCAVDAAHDGRQPQGVQHQLAVGEIDPFGVASGAGGVKHGGDRIFVEILECVLGAGCRQQRLILADKVGQVSGLVGQVRQQQGLFDGGQVSGHGLIKAGELAVDQHQAVIGMIDGVSDLLGGKPDVHGVNDRANHRDGKHAFQITVTVPVHDRHRVTGLYTRSRQHIGQTADALFKGRVAVADGITVNNLTRLFIATAG